jgi:ubiquinone/menaquinone biosynthesis C-methylase UbiE
VHEGQTSEGGRTYDQRSYEGWQTASGGWERESGYIRRAGRPVSEWMLERVAPAPGMVLLELAGGLGDTALMAAPALLPGGHVILTDRSPAMMDAARRRIEADGVDNIECRPMDAASLDLPDETADAAVCRWGYMLMSDPGRALLETRRVLRPGGRLALSVWGKPEDNRWAGVISDLMLERGLIEPADPSEPSMFALHDPERLESLVAGNGFADVEIGTVDTAWVYESGEDFWRVQTAVSPTAQKGLARLPQEGVAEVRAEVVAAMDALRSDGEVTLPARCVMLAARRPPAL